MTTMAPGLVVLIIEKQYSHWGLAEGNLVPLGSSFATLANFDVSLASGA